MITMESHPILLKINSMYNIIVGFCTKNIKRVIISIAVIGILIPVSVSFLLVFHSYSNIQIQEISNESSETAISIDNELYDLMKGITKISNLIINDKKLIDILSDDTTTHFQRTMVIEEISENLVSSNIFVDTMHIVIIDNEGQVYTNWINGKNSFILKNDTISWGGTSKYVKYAFLQTKFEDISTMRELALLREMIDLRTNNQVLGQLFISISEHEVIKIIKDQLAVGDKAVLKDLKNNTSLSVNFLEDINRSSVEEINTYGNDSYKLQNIEGEKYLTKEYNLNQFSSIFGDEVIKIEILSDYNRRNNSIFELAKIFLFVAIMMGLILFVLGWILIRWIATPIQQLSEHLGSFSLHNKKIKELKRTDEVGFLYNQYNEMIVKIDTLFLEAKQQNEIKERYRYESLKAQINPHFLFNTLNMIRSMAIINHADDISESIEAIGTILQSNMNKDGNIIRIGDELNSIESYAFILNKRFEERFVLNIDIDENIKSFYILKFMIQPIVENAFIHGFKNKSELYIVKIMANIQDDKLIVRIADNGVGISREKLEMLNNKNNNNENKKHKISGIGLINLTEIINVLYGSEYGIQIESIEGQGTTITATLPIIRGEDKDA